MVMPSYGPDPFQMILQNVANNDANTARHMNTVVGLQNAKASQQAAATEARSDILQALMSNSEGMAKVFGADVGREAITQMLPAITGTQLGPDVLERTAERGNINDTARSQGLFAEALQAAASGVGTLSEQAGYDISPNEVLGGAAPNLTLNRVPRGVDVTAASRVASARAGGGGGQSSNQDIREWILQDLQGNTIGGASTSNLTDKLYLTAIQNNIDPSQINVVPVGKNIQASNIGPTQGGSAPQQAQPQPQGQPAPTAAPEGFSVEASPNPGKMILKKNDGSSVEVTQEQYERIKGLL